MLTRPEIYKIVNDYIGISGGYLGDFSYKTHADFYPYYCDLDIDPSEIVGTTRERFIKILVRETPINQVKILKGVLNKYPVSYFDWEMQAYKQTLHDQILDIIARLETASPLAPPDLTTTTEVVEKAISDAKMLIKENGAVSGMDRLHTALHGYLKAVCKAEDISYPENADINQLFKALKSTHPSFNGTARKDDINKILMSLSNILNVLNPIRNNASIAHPNENLLDEPEAMLVVNTVQTILIYLNAKFK